MEFLSQIFDAVDIHDFSFANFKKQWIRLDLNHIHHVRPEEEEYHTFLQELYHCFVEKIRREPNNLPHMVWAVYSLYTLYYTQITTADQAPAKIEASEYIWDVLVDLSGEFKEFKISDPLLTLIKLIQDNCFKFSLCPSRYHFDPINHNENAPIIGTSSPFDLELQDISTGLDAVELETWARKYAKATSYIPDFSQNLGGSLFKRNGVNGASPHSLSPLSSSLSPMSQTTAKPRGSPSTPSVFTPVDFTSVGLMLEQDDDNVPCMEMIMEVKNILRKQSDHIHARKKQARMRRKAAEERASEMRSHKSPIMRTSLLRDAAHQHRLQVRMTGNTMSIPAILPERANDTNEHDGDSDGLDDVDMDSDSASDWERGQSHHPPQKKPTRKDTPGKPSKRNEKSPKTRRAPTPKPRSKPSRSHSNGTNGGPPNRRPRPNTPTSTPTSTPTGFVRRKKGRIRRSTSDPPPPRVFLPRQSKRVKKVRTSESPRTKKLRVSSLDSLGRSDALTDKNVRQTSAVLLTEIEANPGLLERDQIRPPTPDSSGDEGKFSMDSQFVKAEAIAKREIVVNNVTKIEGQSEGDSDSDNRERALALFDSDEN